MDLRIKMISILYDYTYYNGLAGTFTSLIDIYLSLLRFGIKSQFVIFLGESESTFHLAKTQFPQIPFVEARKKNDFYRLNVSFNQSGVDSFKHGFSQGNFALDENTPGNFG